MDKNNGEMKVQCGTKEQIHILWMYLEHTE